MSILKKMDFFWKKHNENNLTWKECLMALDAPSELKKFGFYALVEVKDLIKWLSERDSLIVGLKGDLQFLVGETGTGRLVITPLLFKGLDEDLVEKHPGEPRVTEESKVRQLLEEALDKDFPVVAVRFQGFYDSVVFRAEVEEDFDIEFPPFSQWR